MGVDELGWAISWSVHMYSLLNLSKKGVVVAFCWQHEMERRFFDLLCIAHTVKVDYSIWWNVMFMDTTPRRFDAMFKVISLNIQWLIPFEAPLLVLKMFSVAQEELFCHTRETCWFQCGNTFLSLNCRWHRSRKKLPYRTRRVSTTRPDWNSNCVCTNLASILLGNQPNQPASRPSLGGWVGGWVRMSRGRLSLPC